jgi:hypothetical protein
MTTGKKFVSRTHDKVALRMLDAKTKAILNRILQEPSGVCSASYLRAFGPMPKSR